MVQSISSLPIGSKVKFGRYQVEAEEPQEITWQVAAINHAGYPDDSVTLITEQIIDLRAFDAREVGNSNADRRNYGNNRYKDSNMRQWLNSKEEDWYTAQHSADAPPTSADTGGYATGYNAKAGFLHYFDTDEIASILPTTLTVARNTVTDGGGSETIIDKIFLLSETEVGLGNENNIQEGAVLELFKVASNRISKLTAQCYANTLSTNKPSTAADKWYWWLRTPYASYSCHVRYVNTSGSLGYNNAYYGSTGLRPALNLTSAISVSDAPDDDGCYTLLPRKAPVISGTDSDLGYKFEGFNVQYTVTDAPENDVVTVVEAVNGKTIKNYVPVLGETNTAAVSSETVYGLPNNEPAILTITATDNDGSTVRAYTFKPWLYSTDHPRVAVQMQQPIKTGHAITEVTMTLDFTMEIEAELTILACNNAFDTEPTWEDITAAVMSKQTAKLQNGAKTASNWGLNVQIALKKENLPGVLAINSFVISYQ